MKLLDRMRLNLEERSEHLDRLFWPGMLWWPAAWRAHRNLRRLEAEFRQLAGREADA